MDYSRRVFAFILTALVVLSSSVFLFDGKAYAESINGIEPVVTSPLRQNEPLIEQQSRVIDLKSDKLNDTTKTVETLQSKKETLSQKLEAEQKAIADLKQKIADKKAAAQAAAEAAKATPVVHTYSVPVGGVHYNCGDNYYAAFIYGQESGGHVTGNCDTGARNASGCLGIGQACPGSKLLAACPSLDYACENAFFTNYASKYGGWAGAYNFWKANGWW